MISIGRGDERGVGPSKEWKWDPTSKLRVIYKVKKENQGKFKKKIKKKSIYSKTHVAYYGRDRMGTTCCHLATCMLRVKKSLVRNDEAST